VVKQEHFIFFMLVVSSEHCFGLQNHIGVLQAEAMLK